MKGGRGRGRERREGVSGEQGGTLYRMVRGVKGGRGRERGRGRKRERERKREEEREREEGERGRERKREESKKDNTRKRTCHSFTRNEREGETRHAFGPSFTSKC